MLKSITEKFHDYLEYLVIKHSTIQKVFKKTYLFCTSEKDDYQSQPLDIKFLDKILEMNIYPEGYADAFIDLVNQKIYVKHIVPKTVYITITYTKSVERKDKYGN